MRKKRCVVDSSVIIKWLSSQGEKHLEQADKLLSDVQSESVELYTSELSKYEVPNALLKGKGLKFTQANAALATFYTLPFCFVSETRELARESYRIGQKLNISYYDAAFRAVAKKVGGFLVTDNIKHQGKSTEIKVVPLVDYLTTSPN